MAKLKCPKCKGHNLELLANDKNYKESYQTALDLNPLHPLTPFKTKKVRKEKTSASKVGMGIMTGGASLLFTGTKKKLIMNIFAGTADTDGQENDTEPQRK